MAKAKALGAECITGDKIAGGGMLVDVASRARTRTRTRTFHRLSRLYWRLTRLREVERGASETSDFPNPSPNTKSIRTEYSAEIYSIQSVWSTCSTSERVSIILVSFFPDFSQGQNIK